MVSDLSTARPFGRLDSLLIIPSQFGTFTVTGSFRQNFVSAFKERKKSSIRVREIS